LMRPTYGAETGHPAHTARSPPPRTDVAGS
jgi:hypothetical protein